MQKHKEQEILPSVFITKETRMKKTTTGKIISVIMANFAKILALKRERWIQNVEILKFV